ncbi:MAG: response regulator [Chitinophagaceae bacterium]
MKQNKDICIIIVEDNIFYQQLIAKQLESISSNIHFFTNGEECINKLDSLKPDIIILDNNLEGIMSGLDTLKVIRIAEPYIHVILFSSELKLNTTENLSFYGVFEYLEKNSSGFKKLKDRILEIQPLIVDC